MPREGDFDGVLRQTGEADQVAGQIDDLHRLAHLEHEDFAAAPIVAACSTSCDASGIVMKNRVIRGSVTVIGPPRRICC